MSILTRSSFSALMVYVLGLAVAAPAWAQSTPPASEPPPAEPAAGTAASSADIEPPTSAKTTPGPAPDQAAPPPTQAERPAPELHPNVLGVADHAAYRKPIKTKRERRFLPHDPTPIGRAGPDFGPGAPLPQKLSVTPYGVVKGDLFWAIGGNDNSGVNSFDVPQFGVPLPTGSQTNVFGASARKTRFGVHVLWPLPPSYLRASAIDAKVEIDFYGGVFGQGTLSYFSIPRLRFAYAGVSWGRIRLVFGQDNILFSPQIPDSLFRIIPQAGGGTGNLFGRFPQVRVEGSTGGKLRFIWVGGLLANVQNDALSPADQQFALFRRPQGGELSVSPAVQGHIGIAGDVGRKPWTVGLGGHYGRRRTQLYVPAGQPNAGTPSGTASTNSWAGLIDVLIPLHRTLTLKGEAWVGQALEPYTGGIFQGLRFSVDSSGLPTAVDGAIRSVGGWGELHYNPIPWLQIASVFLADNPIDSTLPAYDPATGRTNSRSRIITLYEWIAIEVAKGYLIGVEYDYLRTNLRSGLTLTSHYISLNGLLYF